MSRPAVTGNQRGASTGNPRVVSTGNPRKAGTESPPLSAVREFLSFWNHPTLSAHDIAWYMRLRMLFGERSDFAARLKEELKNFDDFPNLLNALKAYHGKAEDRRARQDIEKTHRSPHQEKDSQKGGAREEEGGRQDFREIRRALANEKALAQIPPGKEKESVRRIIYLFKGWCIEDRSAVSENRQGIAFT